MALTDTPSGKEPGQNTAGSDMLSYGAAAFAKSVSSNILSDLLDVYHPKDAYAVMAIANHHIVIDETLKQYSITVNDLSAFSYKARKIGRWVEKPHNAKQAKAQQ